MKHTRKGNFFSLPNEMFLLGLSPGELAVYSYLRRCENRKTHQCWPSYKTIGKAVGMSENTVRKYTLRLEERGLITTEPTEVITRDGQRRNGNLLYTILPIQEAINHSYERQMVKLEEVTERQQVAKELRKQGRVRPCEPLCEALPGAAGTGHRPALFGRIWAGFGGSYEDESRSRINTRRHARHPVRSLLPAVRAVTGVFREFQSGVKNRRLLSLLRSLSPKAYSSKKKVGVIPRKGSYFEQERKICPLSHP